MHRRTFCSRHLMALLTVLALSALVPAGALAEGTGDYPYSGSGTWRITQDTRLSNERLEVRGDIVIESGARLRLVDTTITINCSAPGQYKLVVRPGGSLDLVNSSVMPPANSSNWYELVVEPQPASQFQSWPLDPVATFLVGIMLGIGVGFPAGIGATAYAYKRWFSRNLPPPV